MNNDLVGFALFSGASFAAGLVLSGCWWVGTPNRDLIAECERSLPRTEHCVLIAVPEHTQKEKEFSQ
jgi:hypothetical protein